MVAAFRLFATSGDCTKDADKGEYFRLGQNLYAGNAIVFAYDEAGETIDVPERVCSGLIDHFERLPTRLDVENAIFIGKVNRPVVTVNGEEVWRWPEPKESNPLLKD